MSRKTPLIWQDFVVFVSSDSVRAYQYDLTEIAKGIGSGLVLSLICHREGWHGGRQASGLPLQFGHRITFQMLLSKEQRSYLVSSFDAILSGNGLGNQNIGEAVGRSRVLGAAGISNLLPYILRGLAGQSSGGTRNCCF